MTISFIVLSGASSAPLAASTPGDGPYLHDPTSSLVITETQTTLAQLLEVGHQYPSVTVASTTDFPDERGWLVFGFGFEYQVGPIPYLGKSGPTQLLLDPAFTIPNAVPVSASVNLAALMSDDDDKMPHGDGDFWATPSPAGRAACEDDIDLIVAGGREVIKTVVYPSDVGLGGSGLPTKGVPRLSGVVSVFASDDIDAEVEAAR